MRDWIGYKRTTMGNGVFEDERMRAWSIIGDRGVSGVFSMLCINVHEAV